MTHKFKCLRPKTIKLLQENIGGKNHCAFGLDNDFLGNKKHESQKKKVITWTLSK